MTTSIRICCALSLLAFLTACRPDVDGACTSDADCKAGTACYRPDDAEEGVCVSITGTTGCTRACGEAFHCETTDGAVQRCVLDEGKGGSATLVSPAPNAVVGPGARSVICQATAPQFRGITLWATDAAGTKTVLPTPVSTGNGVFETSWDPIGFSEGQVRFECEASYGPEGFEVGARAAPVTITLDRTSPGISITAPTGWHGTTGRVLIEATITDGGAGLVTDGAQLAFDGLAPFPGVSTGGDTFAFDVDLSVFAQGTQERLTFTVTAQDHAGNTGRQESFIDVDGTPPEFTVAASDQAAWHARGAAFSLPVAVALRGAPVVAASVVLGDAMAPELFVGTATSEGFTFEIDPARISPADTEGAVALTLKASDEAGNAVSLPLQVHIDDVAPTLGTTPMTAWNGRGANVTLSVTATDAGAGVNLSAVRVDGSVSCTSLGAGAFACPLDTTKASAGGTDPALSFTVTASDLVGNQSTTATTVKVDDQPPAVHITTDFGTYRPRGETVEVRGTAEDAGAGIAISGATFVVSGKEYAATYLAAQGVFVASIPAAEVSLANSSEGRVITLLVNDLLGHAGSGTALWLIDDVPPTLTVQPPSYAATDADGISSVLRNGSISLTVQASDSGAGVSSQTLAMGYTKADGVTKARVLPVESGGNFVFTFDAADADLPTDRGDVTLTFEASDRVGNATGATTQAVTVSRKLWRFSSGLLARVNGSVALAQGRVYATLSGVGTNFYALDAATGQVQGSATMATVTPLSPPSIGANTVYFTARDGSGLGVLKAFPLTPSATWAPTWETGGFRDANGGLAVASLSWNDNNVLKTFETVLFGTSGNFVLALAKGDAGVLRSPTNTVSGSDPSNATVAINGEQIWFGTKNGLLTRLDWDGAFLTYSAATNTTATGPLPQPGAALLSNGDAVALPVGALQLWSASTITKGFEATSASFAAQASGTAAASSDSTFVFGSEDGRLFRVDTRLAGPLAIQATDLPAYTPVRGTPALDDKGNIYAMAGDGVLRVYGSAGELKWSHATGYSNLTSPMSPLVGCNGVVYVGTGNGSVVALITDSTGPGTGPWPRFQHDNRNTGNAATQQRVGGVCVD